MTPDTWQGWGVIAGGVAGSVVLAWRVGGAVVEKLRSRNGHASPGATTQALQQQDMRWRQDVDEELEKYQRAIFEPEGALRSGDHAVRNDVQRIVSQVALTQAEQYRELRGEIRALVGEVNALGKAVAARGNCCEHCAGA